MCAKSAELTTCACSFVCADNVPIALDMRQFWSLLAPFNQSKGAM